jgi:hypothetical protein
VTEVGYQRTENVLLLYECLYLEEHVEGSTSIVFVLFGVFLSPISSSELRYQTIQAIYDMIRGSDLRHWKRLIPARCRNVDTVVLLGRFLSRFSILAPCNGQGPGSIPPSPLPKSPDNVLL